ncbi:MAG: glycosyltransferase family 2 protein [Phreatobacter sp.]|uniref:glycosyltransferase family 2 protein n=1 Tax=Phreatobacter sp. TaxID=1966341 RepID=UPI002732BD96|nr:glycosyltransferase family 2 protein [Phreatobacter sp.]MDP2801311.1 glycosyltransferase family 2 protein [Phreatobacter sp.]
MKGAVPQVSVVAPCFNEAEGLREFYRRCSAACSDAVGGDHEIILVDDGSTDATWTLIEALANADERVVGLRLLRNHGHQLASSAGLAAALGERVLLTDADLQDPPELLSSMMVEMDQGADVVYGLRTGRDGESWFKRTCANLFYRSLSWLTDTAIPRDAGDFRLMSRTVVDAFLLMPEQHRFIRGMVSWIGGRQVAMPYRREGRYAGTTKYPFRKMVRLAVDAVTSFSTRPLRIATWSGLVFAFLALGMLGYSLVQWARGSVIDGWTSLMAATSLFAGVQLLVLGILGEYLGRLVQESKNRPLFLVGAVKRGDKLHAVSAEFSRLPPSQQHAIRDSWRIAGAPPDGP